MLRFLLHHPLLNTPALSPTLRSPRPHRWHRSLPTSTDTHTPPSTCLSRAAAGRKFIAAPDCYGQILIKCCFAAICLIGHRRDVWSMCRLCLHPRAWLVHTCSLLPAPGCSWLLLAVTTEDGTLGKRGIEEEQRPKEAAGLEKAGRSPPLAARLTLPQVLLLSHSPPKS